MSTHSDKPADRSAEAVLKQVCIKFEEILAIEDDHTFMLKTASDRVVVQAIALFNMWSEILDECKAEVMPMVLAAAMVHHRYGKRLLLAAAVGPSEAMSERVFDLMSKIGARLADAEPEVESVEGIEWPGAGLH